MSGVFSSKCLLGHVFSCILLLASANSKSCTLNGIPCQCTADGHLLDFRKLFDSKAEADRTKAEEARFIYQDSITRIEYYYQPCFPFSQKDTTCLNGLMCQKNKNNWTILAKPGNVVYAGQIGDDSLTIEYENSGTKIEIDLKCAGSTHFMKDHRFSTNKFVLQSPLTCIPGLSSGSVFLIVLAVMICVYLLGGISFNKFIRHDSGLNLIPHREFWVDLPLKVRDGFSFVCGRCRTQQDQSYDQI